MPGLATEGFGLSQLDKAPDFPTNLGKFDVQAIYDRVRQGMENQEFAASSGGRQAQTRAQQQAAIAQANAATIVAPEQAKAEIATAQATPGDVAQRSQILRTTAETGAAAAGGPGAPVATAGAAATLAGYAYDKQMLARAQAEYGPFKTEYAQAGSMTDPNARAAALRQLPIKYPWLSLPKFAATTTAEIYKGASEAQVAGQKQAELENKLAVTRIAAEALAMRGPAASAALMRNMKHVDGTPMFSDDQITEAIDGIMNKQGYTEKKNPNAAPAGSIPGEEDYLLGLQSKLSASTDPAEQTHLQAAIDAVNANVKFRSTPKAAKSASSDLAAILGPKPGAAAPAPTAATPAPANPAGAPQKVDTWDAAKALPIGSTYIGPDGQTYIRGK